MVSSVPSLNLAKPDDADAIDRLMKASIRDLFPSTYDARQTASSILFIGSVDRQLIEDGTYYVVDVDGDIVACGGWSRRAKLYTGSGAGADDLRLLDPATEPAHIRAMFTRGDWTRRGLGRRILEACEAAAKVEGFLRLNLTATLPGVPFYAAFGFQRVGDHGVEMPDGVADDCVDMEKPIV
jgi:GNAT superfamily N-acetyltransferase